MEDNVKLVNGKYTCSECSNENTLDEANEGDIVECEFCGIEYEITSVNDDGTATLSIIEEEK